LNIIDIEGKKVLLKFDEKAINDFNHVGITVVDIWADVTGVDKGLGIWIRHPSYKIAVWWDENKQTIPQDQRKEEVFPADIYIPLTYIKSILVIQDEKFSTKENGIPLGFVSGTGNAL